jgi:hypothetical protein
MTFDPAAFAPAVAALLRPARLAPLGPGRPNAAARAQLHTLAEDAFRPHRVVNRALADACRAGLWLYHDFLDEAHTISQELDTAEGSFWHALVHRREPDFSNSKYWFRRVGTHPVFEPLRAEAARLAEGALGPAAFLTRQTSWDPFAFVDLCEASYDEKAPDHELCRRVQGVEWELLFDHCYRGAVGIKA